MRAWAGLAILALTASPAPAAEPGHTSRKFPTGVQPDRVIVDTGRLSGRHRSRAAHGAPSPPLAAARLEGRFELLARVSVAHAMTGEHVGEIVTRSWVFKPQCAAGPCRKVLLVRARARGSDTTMLSEQAPGKYHGAGEFFAPLACGGRTYAHGELVPFTIRVKVTARAPSPAGTIVATRVSASYTNRARTNLTPCVDVHRHDAAVYTGAQARRRL